MTPTTQKALKLLDEEIPYVDIKPYSHNIVGLALKMLFDEIGRDEALKIIRDKYKILRQLGWKQYWTDEE